MTKRDSRYLKFAIFEMQIIADIADAWGGASA